MVCCLLSFEHTFRAQVPDAEPLERTLPRGAPRRAAAKRGGKVFASASFIYMLTKLTLSATYKPNLFRTCPIWGPETHFTLLASMVAVRPPLKLPSEFGVSGFEGPGPSRPLTTQKSSAYARDFEPQGGVSGFDWLRCGDRQTDRPTDRQTAGQTDRQTD